MIGSVLMAKGGKVGMIITCSKHQGQEWMCECPKCHEKSVLESMIKDIREEIKKSDANFEWINGMWETVEIINKRIRQLDS